MSVGHDGTILISGGSSCLGEQIALALAAAGAPLRLWLAPGAPPPAAASHGLGTGGRLERGQPARTGARRGAAAALHR